MIKVLLVALLTFMSLESRENPFFPSDGEKDIPYTSNQSTALLPLKRAAISLPTYARVIQSVTINYKNLDGSQESRSIDLDNSVDWHLPIFISQNYSESNNDVKAPKENKKYKKLTSIKYAGFYSSGKKLKITTKDKIIRNFLLVKPHRIVIDFKKDVHLKSHIKEFKNNIFSKIRIGNHSGYYRAVIELDGLYRYKMKKVSDGYTFELQ